MTHSLMKLQGLPELSSGGSRHIKHRKRRGSGRVGSDIIQTLAMVLNAVRGDMNLPCRQLVAETLGFFRLAATIACSMRLEDGGLFNAQFPFETVQRLIACANQPRLLVRFDQVTTAPPECNSLTLPAPGGLHEFA